MKFELKTNPWKEGTMGYRYIYIWNFFGSFFGVFLFFVAQIQLINYANFVGKF
jgi:hypothetical protein